MVTFVLGCGVTACFRKQNFLYFLLALK
jgi:hypothetical protein